MNKTDKLTKALEYLEDSLENGVTAASVAKYAGFSHSHLTRTFEILFGVSLGEYIARRRLNPEIWPPLRDLPVRGKVDLSGARIAAKPQFCARGVVIATTSEVNRRDRVVASFWKRIIQSKEIVALIAASGSVDLLGLCWGYNPVDSSFSYAIAVESPHDLPLFSTDTAVSILVSAATYAVFPLASMEPDAVQATWEAIYGEWFPVSGYEHAGTPEFEAFRLPSSAVRSGKDDLPASAIWVPIRKSANLT